MKDFENKLTYNQISFYLSNSLHVAEREMHTYHEILFYINGDAEFLTEKGQYALRQNTLLMIPRETYHFFRLPESGHFTRLKISIPDAVVQELSLESLFSAITVTQNIHEAVFFVLNRLHKALKEPKTKNSPFYAYSMLMMLLAELDMTGISDSQKATLVDLSMLLETLSYIAKNLSGDLSIKTLAKQTNLSASTLTHTFKKELGISLHEYVTQRRLIYAKNLILENQKPSKIYLDCGFQDYSSFYKAYLKFFGYPPSKEKQNR